MRLELINITPGRRHGWFNSNYGRIRKSLNEIEYFPALENQLSTEPKAIVNRLSTKRTFWGWCVYYLKKIFK